MLQYFFFLFFFFNIRLKPEHLSVNVRVKLELKRDGGSGKIKSFCTSDARRPETEALLHFSLVEL